MTVRVALIVGSLRKGSYSRAIGMALKAVIEQFREQVQNIE